MVETFWAPIRMGTLDNRSEMQKVSLKVPRGDDDVGDHYKQYDRLFEDEVAV